MKKQDFILLFSVKNANPNGDPLEENRPRTNDEGYGEVSAECIKRKIRNRLFFAGQSIFIQTRELANDGYRSLAERLTGDEDISCALKEENVQNSIVKLACKKWIDVRLFGQLFAFSGFKKMGSVSLRGAITIEHAVSVEPVLIKDIQITKSVNGENKSGKEGPSSDTMGSKAIVESGMYIVKGSVNPFFSDKNGVTNEDIEHLKKALCTLFENDESSARPAGSMKIEALYWFEQEENTNIVPSYKIHNTLVVSGMDGNYNWEVNGVPEGVSISRLI